MKKSRSLAKRNVALAKPNMSISTIAIIALVGLVVFLIWKNKSTPTIGSYKNEESWDVAYNDDGMPTRITIYRDAKRS